MSIALPIVGDVGKVVIRSICSRLTRKTSCVVSTTDGTDPGFFDQRPIRIVGTGVGNISRLVRCKLERHVGHVICISSKRVCNRNSNSRFARGDDKCISYTSIHTYCPSSGQTTRALYVTCKTRCSTSIIVTELDRACNPNFARDSGEMCTRFVHGILGNRSVILGDGNRTFHS